MKIVMDSGYAARQTGIRCYYVSERVVDFDPATTPEEVQAFIDAEKKAWYGQEFSARVIAGQVYIRRGVDSGD